MDWSVILTALGGLFTAVVAALAGWQKGMGDSVRKDRDQITNTYGRIIGKLEKQNESQQAQINLLMERAIVQSREHTACQEENKNLRGQLTEALNRITSLEEEIIALKKSWR